MDYVKRLVSGDLALSGISKEIEAFAEIVERAARNGGTIFACGNGGSASDADHISGELLKSFIIKRKVSSSTLKRLVELHGEIGVGLAGNLEEGIRSVPLGAFQAFLSAYGNDVEWKMAYAQLLYVMGREGDVLVGISCSGNAENVSNAFKVAKLKGVRTVLLTGSGGGRCIKDADIAVMVPEKDTYRIQEYHSRIYHAVCAEVERRIFGGKA